MDHFLPFFFCSLLLAFIVFVFSPLRWRNRLVVSAAGLTIGRPRVGFSLSTFRIPLEKVFYHHYLGNSVVVVWLLSKLVITGPWGYLVMSENQAWRPEWANFEVSLVNPTSDWSARCQYNVTGWGIGCVTPHIPVWQHLHSNCLKYHRR